MFLVILGSKLQLSQFQTWRKYDSDHSGYIDAEELKVRKYLQLFSDFIKSKAHLHPQNLLEG